MLEREQTETNLKRICLGSSQAIGWPQLDEPEACFRTLDKHALQTVAKRNAIRNRKVKTMTPTNPTPKYAPITRKVFDLTTFDDVDLVKDFNPPAAPSTLEEALAAVANDQTKLLTLIHKGLVSEARDAQYADIHGFKVVGEDGETNGEYAGKFAEGDVSKLINGAILTMAKLQAGGAWDSKTKDEKRALKAKAAEFIRSNPAMLGSFMTQTATAEPAAV